jgi:hypothetical protein
MVGSLQCQDKILSESLVGSSSLKPQFQLAKNSKCAWELLPCQGSSTSWDHSWQDCWEPHHSRAYPPSTTKVQIRHHSQKDSHHVKEVTHTPDQPRNVALQSKEGWSAKLKNLNSEEIERACSGNPRSKMLAVPRIPLDQTPVSSTHVKATERHPHACDAHRRTYCREK